MHPTLRVLFALALLALPALSRAQARYALGGFCSACNTASAVNRFYDDGLHDDGAPGDGVFGAIVTVDRPAGRYAWRVDETDLPGFANSIPYCWCSTPPAYAALWTSGPGDVIHFRWNGASEGVGWGGLALATDHGMPAGASLEFAMPFADVDDPPTASPATLVGTVWSAVVTVATPGTYSMLFRTPAHDARFTAAYNADCGCFPGEQPHVTFTTTMANSSVRVQFDAATGLMRGVEFDPTPARRPSWGGLKSVYR